jgi:predicted phosphodiesterase
MTTFIATDYHGKNPLPIIKQLQIKGVNKIASLGDYDDPKILESLINLDIEKRLLIGNHDYHFSIGEKVYSSLLQCPPEHYIDMWLNNQKALKFVLEASKIGVKRAGKKKGKKIVEKIKNKKVAYVHGSLERYDSDNPTRDCFLWGRFIRGKNKAKTTLKEMKRLDYWILFRGHDHFSEVWSLYKKSTPYNGKIKTETANKKRKIKFRKDRRYIVNIGAFKFGTYVLFDEENAEIEFCSWKNLR